MFLIYLTSWFGQLTVLGMPTYKRMPSDGIDMSSSFHSLDDFILNVPNAPYDCSKPCGGVRLLVWSIMVWYRFNIVVFGEDPWGLVDR